MAGGIQTQVNVQPAPAFEGDFCNNNPRAVVDAGPGGLVAGPSGVTAGRFAWAIPPFDIDGGPTIANNFGSGPVAGFVHRNQQGLITTFLADASMAYPSGFPVVLFSEGGFWVKNAGTTQALPGQKAYARFTDGAAMFAATGTPPQGYSVTASIAPSTFSVTGSLSGDVLTVTAVTSGTIVPGAAISGTGVITGTSIVGQISGTTGGIGTYRVSIAEQSAASTTISGTYGTMTVTVVGSGAVAVGDTVAGASAGTIVTAFGTGTGGTGTYIVNNTQTVASGTLTGAAAVETKWVAMSTGNAGELVKISSWPLG